MDVLRQCLIRPGGAIGHAAGMLELLVLLIGIIPAALRSRRDLVLENLLRRQQLAADARPRRRPRFRTWDKLLLSLGRRLSSNWRRHLFLVTPDTVVRWRRLGWRLFWRWRSRSVGGRPRLSIETRELIRSMFGMSVRLVGSATSRCRM
jgi:putative transposase